MSANIPFLEELSSRSTRKSAEPVTAEPPRPREHFNPSAETAVTKPFMLNFASQAPNPDSSRTPRTTVTKASREPTDVY